VVELSGTIMIGIIHSLIGNSQAGMLLGIWVATLFGEAISGSHFNPAVTIVVMLRKNSSFGSRRLKGILYIVAQLIGGILQAFLSIFLRTGDKFMICSGYGLSSGFGSYVSEAIGTFSFVFIFMLCTDKKT
jgi:glycerol uptake facilitator-like aquaporin